MAGNIEKFKNTFRRLLPKGRAWEKFRLHPLIEGIVGEFCRFEERTEAFLNVELDPGKADELLTDWESMVGIPDECTPENQTLQERREAVLERLARVGALSADFYESIGEFLGFDITVQDCNQFLVGRGRVGDALCNNSIADKFEVGNNAVGDQLQVFSWQSYFEVILPIAEASLFRVGNGVVGEPLRTFGNQLIQCTIRKLKPAHTGVVFSFTESS